MQSFYLTSCVGEGAVVGDDVISDSQALAPAGLSREDTACLCFGFRIACEQAAELCTFVAIDDQNSIHERLQGRFDQKRYCDDLILTTGFVRLTSRFFLNAWMQDRFEPPARIIVGKYEPPHYRAIQRSVVINDGFAKGPSNLIQRGLPGHDDLARDDVCIDNSDAELGKHVRDCGFAARDTAGQADPQWIVGISRVDWHLQEHVQIRVLDGLAVEHRDPACGRQIGTVRNGQLAVATAEHDHRNTDDGADNRG